jgi:peroxiredoxin Q/BCP
MAASAGAVVTGLFNMATTSGRQDGAVQPEAGDVAPDFELPASNGRTYRLRDFVGRRAVVVAWFPKAFTGG